MDIALFYVAVYYATVCGFVLVSHAKNLNDKAELGVFWLVHLVPLAVVFVILDVLFNAFLGSLMFAELPREWLFTARCKRYAKARGWRGSVARFWANQLNRIDPGHV